MVRSCSWDRVGWHSQIFIDLEIGSESQSVHILVPLEHYYISIQNPMVTSDGTWIFSFKSTKNHKDIFFFVNVATHVG